MRSKLIQLTAMLSLLVAGGAALAQDIQERTIRFGHLNNTDHPTSFGVKKFAEIVAAKSGGKIKVQEYASSQLGNELQQQSALQGGVQEMLVASTTSLAGTARISASHWLGVALFRKSISTVRLPPLESEIGTCMEKSGFTPAEVDGSYMAMELVATL